MKDEAIISSKKSWWKMGLGVSLLFLLVVAAVAYFGFKGGFSSLSNKQQADLSEDGDPMEAIKLEEESPEGQVKKITFESGRYYYALRGGFVSNLKQVNKDQWQAGFVIDQDPDRLRVEVILNFTQGKFEVGKFLGSEFEGSHFVEEFDIDGVKTILSNNSKVELRFMYNPTHEFSSFQIREEVILEQLLIGEWSAVKGEVLHSVGLAVLSE